MCLIETVLLLLLLTDPLSFTPESVIKTTGFGRNPKGCGTYKSLLPDVEKRQVQSLIHLPVRCLGRKINHCENPGGEKDFFMITGILISGWHVLEIYQDADSCSRWEGRFQQVIYNICQEQWEKETLCKQLIAQDEVTVLCLKAKVRCFFFQLTNRHVEASTVQRHPREETGREIIKENIFNRERSQFGKILPAVYFMDFYTILEWI